MITIHTMITNDKRRVSPYHVMKLCRGNLPHWHQSITKPYRGNLPHRIQRKGKPLLRRLKYGCAEGTPSSIMMHWSTLMNQQSKSWTFTMSCAEVIILIGTFPRYYWSNTILHHTLYKTPYRQNWVHFSPQSKHVRGATKLTLVVW